MDDVAALTRQFGKADAIVFAASPLGGTVAMLSAGEHTAVVALKGAQVLSWKVRGTEQLWMSHVARLDGERPVRGGIPVCWPWFGPNLQNPALPAHGFARARPWGVAETVTAEGRASVTLATQAPASDAWPYDAEVRLTVTLADGLGVTLETFNRGQTPMPVTAALHTYFRVSDIARVQIEGLENRIYIDKLAGGATRKQSGAITVDREVDRIYTGDTAAIRLVEKGNPPRQIAIASSGSASAVVWNPWVDKSARLGDMGEPDAYRRMICIETANAGPDQRVIGPGARHAMSARYAADRGT